MYMMQRTIMDSPESEPVFRHRPFRKTYFVQRIIYAWVIAAQPLSALTDRSLRFIGISVSLVLIPRIGEIGRSRAVAS